MEHYTSDESDGEPDWEPNTSYNIHDAARCADVPALQIFLAEGDSPDVLSDAPDWKQRRTPLHELCTYNSMFNSKSESDRVRCFELLREAGANLEARTGGHPQASTVLHFAAKGRTTILSLLLEAGVNVNVTNSGGYTPLHWAAAGHIGVRRSTECVELLLKAGAAVNVATTSGGPLLLGATPFAVALREETLRRMWPVFLRAGADIPTNNTDPYIVRVRNAGGFKKYEQAHLARITAILAPTPLLPPELVRKILEFWLHAGYY